MMVQNIALSTLWLSCLLRQATSFLYNPTRHPSLSDLSTSLDIEQTIKLRLDLNLVEDAEQRQLYPSSYSHAAAAPTRLALNGPVLKMTFEAPSTMNKVPMPGSTSNYKRVSTGAHTMDILEPAAYIGMNGLETVALEKPNWEMLWLDENESGKLICGFDVPFPIRRNGATLDHRKADGPLYISFNIYSQESLAVAQAHKYATQAQSAVYMQEKEVELLKMKAANNLLAKAVHYQRAFAAFDKLLVLPSVSHVPEPDQVLELSSGLFVTKEGVVWKKLNPFFGPPSQNLGRAVLSVETNAENNENKVSETKQTRLDELYP